jgi:3-deoxy-manno-octulosonate cytidylyltransferase (CMP-KDO synthetase)
MKRRGSDFIVGVIPARMGSSRFSGKPLAKICGIPMIGHVYMRSKMSKLLDDVFVATCDKEIADYMSTIGRDAIMTSASHERASDRSAEAIDKVEKMTGRKVTIAVMIQGDEPMIRPEMIDRAVEPLLGDRSIEVVNLMSLIGTREEEDDPNEVKVVCDRKGFALYFSREPIPSRKKGARDVRIMKQVCVIPFRRDFLEKFNRLPQTPLEIAESVDMLRVLEHGYKVKMVEVDDVTYSVDTPEDLKDVEAAMKGDELLKDYRKSKWLKKRA